VDIVPRIAATLASLLLIVCSIGVNIARYPIVSQMVSGLDSPSTPVASAEPPAAAEPAPQPPVKLTPPMAKPAAEASPAPAANRPSPAAKKSRTPPLSQPAKSAAKPARVPTAVTASIENPMPVGRILDVRPLVPVVPAAETGEPARLARVDQAGDEVRRLPTLDMVVPGPSPSPYDERQPYLMTATP
jgi:hypothetical protein